MSKHKQHRGKADPSSGLLRYPRLMIQASEYASALPDLCEVNLAYQALDVTYVDRVLSSCCYDELYGSVIDRVGYGRAE